MNTYVVQTNLLVSALAAIITVFIQITLFETVYLSTPSTSEQRVAMSTMTDEDRFQYMRENRMLVTGWSNLKGYFSSSDALWALTKRRILPIFFAVFASLFVVRFWQAKRERNQSENV